jgi:hypothetical protein
MLLVVHEPHACLLNLAIRQQPDERLVVQVNDLNTIAPRIAKITPETGNQLQAVFPDKFVAHVGELRVIANHDSKMRAAILSDHALPFKHCQELMFAELEERVALALVQLLQTENVAVKRHRLLDIADLNRDVIATIDLNTHQNESSRGQTSDVVAGGLKSRICEKSLRILRPVSEVAFDLFFESSNSLITQQAQ